MIHAMFLAVPRGPHDQITRTAAASAGWPERAMGPLLAAVRRPDLRDFGWRPRWTHALRIDAKRRYRARHHADRVPPAGDAEAWLRAARYIRQQRNEAARAHGPHAVAALGRALHAAQDVFSHSNYVDLDPATQHEATEALWECTAAPDGFRLTAFSPGATRPGEPHDAFPHAHCAKDAPGHNDQAQQKHGAQTAYEAARDAAIDFSHRIIADFLDRRSWPHRDLPRRRPFWVWIRPRRAQR